MRYKRILALGDLHFPFHHPDTFRFIRAIIKKYNLNFQSLKSKDKAVSIGDEVDGHFWSFHSDEIDLPYSSSSELNAAKKEVQRLFKLMPFLAVIESNHGSLVYRRGKDAKLPRMVFKSYQDILGTPTWNWHFKLILQSGNQKILFRHGKSARSAALSKSTNLCTVEGHYHTKMEIVWWKGEDQQPKFGAKTGCMIDNDSLAFFYNKVNLEDPCLGHLLIEEGIPKNLPMFLNKNGRWNGVVP